MGGEGLFEGAVEVAGGGEVGFVRLAGEGVEGFEEPLEQGMDHPVLGEQPVGDGAHGSAAVAQLGEDPLVLDGVVDLDDAAVLAAQGPEAAVVVDDRHGAGALRQFLGGDGSGGGLLDQGAQPPHGVAEMGVDHPEVPARQLLGGRQPLEARGEGPRVVVEDFDVVARVA